MYILEGGFQSLRKMDSIEKQEIHLLFPYAKLARISDKGKLLFHSASVIHNYLPLTHEYIKKSVDNMYDILFYISTRKLNKT